ncbi:MAG TPA: ABC transporter ATP-binding protein [Gemmatimonadaceae bacterium]|nr:ABC transporter ATP-binding protein [Gemmatimonadaceae bacterium]
MTALAIRAEGLVRDFGPVRALDHLTFEIPMGIVFGFLGPNGAGKTTAIRTFLGLVEPTAGRAEVLGFDTRREHDRIRERSGALLEHHGLYERLTAAQNLEFTGRVWRMRPTDRRSRARELLEQFGLWDRRDQPVGQWSRGMKQKLAVARAVFHRPPLVFLDEPTAGLDPVASAALRDDLAKLSTAEGVTVFLTTHNLAEAERLCALVGVIRRGRLAALGPPHDLRAGERSALVRVTAGGLDDAIVRAVEALAGVEEVRAVADGLEVRVRPGMSSAPLVTRLVELGAEIEEVRRERPSLEQTFLELVQSDETGASAPAARTGGSDFPGMPEERPLAERGR